MEESDEDRPAKRSKCDWVSCVNTEMECNETEDQSTVDSEGDSEHVCETGPSLVEKDEDKLGPLFGQFHHQMDPEYAQLVSERSASNQEVIIKQINDRYKWIMENRARRKEKEQNIKKFAKSTQSFNNIDSNKLGETEKTTQLLHNLCLTHDSPTKDHSQEICDNQQEKIFFHRGLNKFTKLNFGNHSETDPCLVKKDEDKLGPLFGQFHHQMDPEYAHLVSEQSASNQEVTIKLINDRYKWIMENRARRKEKEQNIRKFTKSTQSFNNIDSNKLGETEKTTQLLDNLCLTHDSPTKDHSQKICDNQHEKIFFHRGLNKFIKVNFGEKKSIKNMKSFDMLNSVSQDHEHTFVQASQNVGSKKYKVTTQTYYDGHDDIISTCEDHSIKKSAYVNDKKF